MKKLLITIFISFAAFISSTTFANAAVTGECVKDAKTLTDVSDKLYQPVKRENKIRVVKIDASGVVVGGF